MICQQVTLSGDAEWPKVADAVIEAIERGEKGLEPGALALAKELHILKAFPATEQRAQSNDDHIDQAMLPRPLNARIFSALEMLDNRYGHGVSHRACSSTQGFCGEQHSIRLSYRDGSTFRLMRSPCLINARHKRTKKMQWTREGAHHVLPIRAMMARDEWESKGQDAVLIALGAAA